MTEPVYGLWLGKSKEAYYQLSEEEKETMMAKRHENLAQVGGKDIASYQTYGSEWEYFGIVEYPSPDAYREHELFCQSLGWPRYFEMMLVYGVKPPETE